MTRKLRLALATLVLAMGPMSVQADPILYTIVLNPDSGPGGSGTFYWDDDTGEISNFFVSLDPFGPFGGGSNNGPQVFDPGVFDGVNFTGDVVLEWVDFFKFTITVDGIYGDFNGRGGGGTYVTAAEVVSVPEPSTFALLALGLLGIGLARRRKKV